MVAGVKEEEEAPVVGVGVVVEVVGAVVVAVVVPRGRLGGTRESIRREGVGRVVVVAEE